MKRLGADPLEIRKEQTRKGAAISRRVGEPEPAKERMTFYIERGNIEILRAYGYQERRSLSSVIEELIETHLKGKVKKQYLRS